MIEVSKCENGIAMFDFITETIIHFEIFDEYILIKCDSFNEQPQIRINKIVDKYIYDELTKLLKIDYDSNELNYYLDNVKIIDKSSDLNTFKKYKKIIKKMEKLKLYEYKIILEKFNLFTSNVYYKKEILEKNLILRH